MRVPRVLRQCWNSVRRVFGRIDTSDIPETTDFSGAERGRYYDRERRERTLEWARKFRQSAADLPAEPEPGVHPVIHEAMRRSFIAEAEKLEREAGVPGASDVPPQPQREETS